MAKKDYESVPTGEPFTFAPSHRFPSSYCQPSLCANFTLILLLMVLTIIVTGEIDGGKDIDSDQCRLFLNQGSWNNNLTKWQIWDLQEAYEGVTELRTFVGPTAGYKRSNLDELAPMNGDVAYHVLFAGDSTMARLALNLPFQIMHPQYGKGTIVKSASRCDVMEYFGLPRSDLWSPPNLTVEGPLKYGLDHEFCNDCSGCNARKQIFGREGKAEATYEYIPIEFARDREFQTPSTTTSQETLAMYLSSLNYTHDLCVASAGIHDIMLRDCTANQFALNVLGYVSLIKPYCKKILWLLPSASLDGPPQTNEGLAEFGDSVQGMCDKVDNNVLLFNIWNMSAPKDLHVDNVHHSATYYNELGRLIFGLH